MLNQTAIHFLESRYKERTFKKKEFAGTRFYIPWDPITRRQTLVKLFFPVCVTVHSTMLVRAFNCLSNLSIHT